MKKAIRCSDLGIRLTLLSVLRLMATTSGLPVLFAIRPNKLAPVDVIPTPTHCAPNRAPYLLPLCLTTR